MSEPKVALLDVNVLVALAWPSHLHHERAHVWFGEYAREGWATCPITQCGFVRVSSNPSVFRDAVSPAEAARLLGVMVSHRSHVFWPDTVSLCAAEVSPTILTGHRQVTDFYLARLSEAHSGRLVTFDGGLRAGADGTIHVIEV